MQFIFLYDLEKDVDNYLRASRSVNNPTPTKSQTRYIEEYGPDFDREHLRKFITGQIEKYQLDTIVEARRMSIGWERIRDQFMERSLNMFSLKDSDEVIHVYLTTDQRCSYNLEGRYFFISITRTSDNQNKTIMHELFHFWTWDVFHDHVESGAVSKADYNTVKESLTVLLNVEFADLLEGEIDRGYPQHQEVREIIKNKWIETKNIIAAFDAGLEALKAEH